jgi:ArsR family transcriptional regulator, arsenate/arsenite/antimonite-responsive transcriptional repressor / arsenate reductase (thioredoxin)
MNFMNTLSQSPSLISLLAHRLRWNIVVMLGQSDRRGLELVRLLKQPPNLVSYHLKRLRKAKLLNEHRSTADGRDVYYSLDVEQLRSMYVASGEELHPALAEANPHVSATSQKPVRVLFLCTHNSARSQMAEAILRHKGQGLVEVFSAGSEPTEIHPLATRVLTEKGIRFDGQHSKHLNEFLGQHFDYIVTVCDQVRETCPVFPDDPQQIHWSFPDPVQVNGDKQRYRAFEKTATELSRRIDYLLLMINRFREKGR